MGGSVLSIAFPEFLLATGNESLHSMIESLDFEMLSVFSTKLTKLLKQYYGMVLPLEVKATEEMLSSSNNSR